MPKLRGLTALTVANALLVLMTPNCQASTASPSAVARSLARDMTDPSEAAPHGVPLAWGWSAKPRVNMGNDPKSFEAFTAWGQLYQCASTNPGKPSAVELTGLASYILSKRDDRWHHVAPSPRLDGAAYREDYAADESIPADTRLTRSGTTIASAGDGRNFHFWPSSGRHRIDPADINGVAVFMRARIARPADAETAGAACYTLSVGADYWKSATSAWAPHQLNNDDAGIGRFKRIQRSWRLYSMTTVSYKTLTTHPLPVLFQTHDLR